MRIVPYDDDDSLEDLETISLIIKAVPFEDSYVPAYSLVAPSDNYFINLDEVNCLMDGIEIANNKIDELIAMMLQSKIANSLKRDDDDVIIYDQEDEEDDEDDTWETD